MFWWYFFVFPLFLTSCGCQKKSNNNNVGANNRMIINDLVDKTIVDIRSAVKRFGFDPVKVPLICHNISLHIPFLGPLTIELNLTNGILNGVSTFKRAGNFYLYFLPSVVRVHVKVRIDRLYATFNYTYSTRVYKDSGSLSTAIENITAILETDYRLDQFVIINPKLKIEHIELTKVNMKTKAKLRLIANAVTNVALPFFKGEITDIAEKTFLQITKKSINYANKNMNSIITQGILGTIESLLQGGHKRR